MGSWPSFAWRSVIAAQKIVRKRCKWQVGDGASIEYGLISGLMNWLPSKFYLNRIHYYTRQGECSH